MESWTKQRALALQDPFVSQWDKGANLRPLEERIGNTCNESQKVLEGKSLANDPNLFAKGFQKTAALDVSGGKNLSYYIKIGSGSKNKSIHFSADGWQMIMKTCSSLLCRLQFPHPWHCWQRLTAAFISSSAFSLCSSDTAPGTLLCSSPRLQRIWNNFRLSVHTLNSDSPTIPPTSSPANLRKAVLLRACTEELLALASSHHCLSDSSCLRNRFSTNEDCY